MAAPRREPQILLIAVTGLLVLSGLDPEAGRLVWLLEVSPVVVGPPC